jgi:hypothetical protein
MKDLLFGRGANTFATLLSSILLLGAACCVWAGYFWVLPAMYVVSSLLVVLALLIPRCLLIANQWERMIVLRLGRAA